MRKHTITRRMLAAAGALAIALGGAAPAGIAPASAVHAAEIPEGKMPDGEWGEANYYLLDDGTLYFGPGKASGKLRCFLQNYVTRIECSPEFDTSEVTTFYGLFDGFTKLTDISGLASWDVSNVTNMTSLFASTAITNVDALSSWDVSKVDNMNSTFYNCQNLTDITGLKDWDVSSLAGMGGMFSNCTSLTSASGLENWNTSALTDLGSAFTETSLNDLTPFANWNTSKLENTCQTFSSTKISDLTPLANWDMSANFGPSGMFSNIDTLVSLKGLEKWNLSNAWTFEAIFSGSDNIKDVLALATWTVPQTGWIGLTGMLDLPNVEKVDLSQWPLANANANNAAPAIYSFRPTAIKLSTGYLSGTDTNKTCLIDGNGADNGFGNEYMSADLLHGPMTSSEIIEGWQDDWSGWWGQAVNVTLKDGSSQETTVKMPALCEVSLPNDTFEKPGYVIAGWKDASGKTIGLDETYEVARAASQSLEAVWERSDEALTNLTFDANGGTGTMESMTAAAGSDLTLPENSFARFKYTFAGWNTEADGSGTEYKAGDVITAGDENADITLYAQWDYVPAHTTIVFDANGGTGTMERLVIEEGKTITLPASAFEKEGYTQTGWNTRPDGSGRDYSLDAAYETSMEDTRVDLYAKWEKNLDYSILDAACAYADGLTLEDFVETGVPAVSSALSEGKALKDAAKSQDEIDQAAMRLNRALLDLRLKTDPSRLKDFDEWSDDYL